MKRAHRAWLMVTWGDVSRDVSPDGRAVIKWKVKNTGKSPAMRVRLNVAPSAIGDAEDFGRQLTRTTAGAMLIPPESLFEGMSTHGPEPGGRFTSDEVAALLRHYPPVLHVAFDLSYLDGFDSRETHVCFVWNAQLSVTPPGGPPKEGAFTACLEHEHSAT